MSVSRPWDFHPHLTSDRLIAVADLIANGRNDALDRHDPSIGGDAWTLGCNAFAYSRYRLIEAIEAGSYPWLSALDRSMQFVFKIGEVPVRFYRGAADDPNDRTLRQSFPELQQLQLGFNSSAEGRDLAYRFAVETDLDASISRIIFVGLRGETAALYWEVPLMSSPAVMYPVGTVPPEGVDLPPPEVKVPGKDVASGAA
jgi:hypothetical protein